MLFAFWTVVVGGGCLLWAVWMYFKASERGTRARSVCCSRPVRSHEKIAWHEQKAELLLSLETRRRDARATGDGHGQCGLTTDRPRNDSQAASGGDDGLPRPETARNKQREQRSAAALFGLLELPRQTYIHQQQTTEREVTVDGESEVQTAGNKDTALLANQAKGQLSEAAKREAVVREEAMRLVPDDPATVGGHMTKCQLDKPTSSDGRDISSCSVMTTKGCGFEYSNWSNAFKMVVSAPNHLSQGATPTRSDSFNKKASKGRRKWLDRYTTSLSDYRQRPAIQVDGRKGNVLDVQSEAVEQLEVGNGLQNNTSCHGDVIHCGHSIVNTTDNEEDGAFKSPCFQVAENIATPDSDRFIDELDHLLEGAGAQEDQVFLADCKVVQKSEQVSENVQFHSPAVGECQLFEDFDFLSACSSPRLSSSTILRRRSLRPLDRQSPSSNPVKNLSTRKDVRSELLDSSVFHPAAVAGLQTKVDFSQLKLRKTRKRSDGSAVCVAGSEEEELMNMSEPAVTLVQVKGRRHVQVRVVEPSDASFCSNDSYLLISPSQLWMWVGMSSNVIEKARVQDLADRVLKSREFGCRATSVQTLEERKNCDKESRQAMRLLLQSDTMSETKKGKDSLCDEEHEKWCVAQTNVYSVSDDELVLNEAWSGKPLKYSRLCSDQVIVYDFGSEVYVWSGKHTCRATRRRAIQLSRALCASSDRFPSWGLFCPIVEGHEPLLFREKFPDWPEQGRIIKLKDHVSSGEEMEHSFPELLPVAPDIFSVQPTDPSPCVLESVNIGRGKGHGDYIVETQSVTVWQVHESSYTELPMDRHGEFCSLDAYVIRWGYQLSHLIDGAKFEMNRSSGSIRCCYFFWQGEHCSVTEKTASALLTVELDKERGPQIRVPQYKEPPVFLQLFDGKMVVYHERSLFDAFEASSSQSTMFTIRSCVENEFYILQLPDLNGRWLQSVSSFIIVSPGGDRLFVWHGSDSASSICEAATKCANSLRQRLSARLQRDFKITTIQDGEEDDLLLDVVETKPHCSSPLAALLRGQLGMRLFQLSSVTGQLVATELLEPWRKTGICNPFPFLQYDLYSVPQPSLFLICTSTAVILWVGKSNIDTNVSRWLRDRKLALQSALDYAAHCGGKQPVFVVKAGYEPEPFQQLFPFWEKALRPHNGVMESLCTAEEEMSNLTRQYTLDELQSKPLPDSVDPSRLETYLSDGEFAVAMGMDRDKFNKLPHWRQLDAKRAAGLF